MDEDHWLVSPPQRICFFRHMTNTRKRHYTFWFWLSTLSFIQTCMNNVVLRFP
ncbi:hypothetical protein HanRHA438_Chr15g0729571 [Helianthus annuus]|nr:hypothetical protein HanRHA438_Chr15g0729571 [Helianthus annuus]